jgi:sulfur carrier protein ThiS
MYNQMVALAKGIVPEKPLQTAAVFHAALGYYIRDMVNITVRSYHELKSITDGLPDGGRLVLADGQTVADVLQHLGVPAEKRTKLVLFINGRMARPQSRLGDGDTLVFFSSIAGG